MNGGDYKETAKGPYGEIGLLGGRNQRNFYYQADYIGRFCTWKFRTLKKA